MPLLDAVLAFALTMLALSSLVGLLQEQVHRARGLRRKFFLRMIDRYFDERVLPVVQDQLDQAHATTVAGLRAQAPNDHDRVARGRAWLQLFGLDALETAIVQGKRTQITAEELVQRLRRSKLFENRELDALAAQLEEDWEKLGQEFTDAFRRHAKLSATLVALALAFGLNIDSLYLLEVYMTDDSTRSAVVALESEALAPTGPAPAGPGAQLAVIRGSAFPIGWDLYPNCPPESTDPRCGRYWASAAGSFRGLSFEERVRINPLRHPRRALGLSSDHQPADPSGVHMSTDGGPAGGVSTLPTDSRSALGKLPRWTLFEWFLGCVLTGILAGRGSPFWIEVVRTMAMARDRLRKDRKDQDQPASGAVDAERPGVMHKGTPLTHE